MEELVRKLDILKNGIGNRKIKILVLGLGSVGMYLLDYLMSMRDEGIEIYVAGRDKEKMQTDVNIIRVSSLIRGQNRTDVSIIGDTDFNDTGSISRCLYLCQPDIIINSSRVYSGLKYGSISWKSIRAYGIWAPLSVRYIKNIMQAYKNSGSNAVVINTSYSDAVIPWLKSAGMPYPDFGSGNINHLIPRIKFAAASLLDIKDYWNIDVTFATSHFHDVVISKEGHTENVTQLVCIKYNDEKLVLDMDKVFGMCKIQMPIDGKRNMMNASSNFEIIKGILSVLRNNHKVKLHCPGVFGEIGGYPVILDGTSEKMKAYIDESEFTLEDMRRKNRESVYLDGIKDVSGGVLYYTDELIKKVKRVFGVNLVNKVSLENSIEVADFLVSEIIEKQKRF